MTAGVYKSGLERDDWFPLRDAYLGASHADYLENGQNEYFDALPERLKLHPIGILIKRYLETGDTEAMGKAAELLVPQADGRWLAIYKS